MRLSVALCLLALIVTPTLAQRPDAPPYARRGAYVVGVTDFVMNDEERPLKTSVWYPALAPSDAVLGTEYTLISSLTLQGSATRDLAPDLTAAPYPLLIFSHGGGASRLFYLNLIEHFTSYGFVVMAVDHIGDAISDGFLRRDLLASFVHRPLDVFEQIALAQHMNAEGQWAGMIDTDQIAVLGHSLGGYTALVAGGAHPNFEQLEAWCADYTDSPLREYACFEEGEAQRSMDLAQSLGLPEDHWYSQDERIRAIVAFAPWNAPLLTVDEITIPTLLMVGTHDRVTFAERDAYQFYERLNAPKTLVSFYHAGHYIFVDDCPDLFIEAGRFGACSDLVWDQRRTHDITNQIVVPFLLYHLKGDTEALAALDPDAIDFLGVTVQSSTP